MNEDTVNQGRRSTRLSISIPVIISGVDTDGNDFRESVRTLIVNKHGGKIGTAHHLALGTEVTVENAALSVVAKANVVWLSGKHYSGDLHHVGLQLIEAQNVWGIAFPPDDWSTEPADDNSATPDDQPVSAPATRAAAETPVSSLEDEEVTIRLLQELQRSADDHAREFKDRVKQLTNRVGLELELELRERAASAKAREVGALEEEIKTLKESLSASSKEIAELQLRIQEIKGALQAAAQSPPPPAVPLQEARRQLTAMANSVVARMNSAAAEGLSEYRNLLQKENQENAERLRRAAEKHPLPRPGPSPES
jgi:hypothetical protein